MRVLYFGTYDRTAGRNAILIEGLRAAGATVRECHVPLWRDTTAKLDAARRGPRTAAALARQSLAWARLARAHAREPDYDVLFVGATAHLDLPLAARLARRRDRPLVFDPLVSISETIRDRALLPPDARRLQALGALEGRLFRLPDLCLADTTAHAEAFGSAFGLAPARTCVIPASAPSVYRRMSRPYRTDAESAPGASHPIRVVYFGQFIPLHGLAVVLGAADRLRRRADIAFELVGIGQRLPEIRAQVRVLDLPNLCFYPVWLPPERLLGEHIQPADICLGIFGDQPKAGRVVPFKVYAALAAGRAVLTSDTPALREMLRPGEEVWTVPPADPAALAEAIACLADRPDLRARLAAAGQAAWDARFAPEVLGARLLGILEHGVERRGAARSPDA